MNAKRFQMLDKNYEKSWWERYVADKSAGKDTSSVVQDRFNKWIQSQPDDTISDIVSRYDQFLKQSGDYRSRSGEFDGYNRSRPNGVFTADAKKRMFTTQASENEKFLRGMLPKSASVIDGATKYPSAESIYAEYNRRGLARRRPMTPATRVEQGSFDPPPPPPIQSSHVDAYRNNINKMLPPMGAPATAIKSLPIPPIPRKPVISGILPDGRKYTQQNNSAPAPDVQGWWTNPELLAKANKSTEMSRLAGRPNVAENEAKDMIRQFWASNPELHKNLLEYRTKNREFDIRKFEALQEVRRQQIASEGGVKQAEIIRGQSDSAKFIDYASNMAAARNYREAQKASRLAEIFDKQQKAAEEDSAELHGVAVESFQRLLKGELADLKEANPNMPDYNVADYNESISRLLKTKGASDLIVKKMSEGQTLKQILDRVYSLPQQR